MKEIFKTVVEPLISLPKWCFLIQTTLICVYHIILKEDAEKVLKSPSFYPPINMHRVSFNRFVDLFFGFFKFIKLEQMDPLKFRVNNFLL